MAPTFTSVCTSTPPLASGLWAKTERHRRGNLWDGKRTGFGESNGSESHLHVLGIMRFLAGLLPWFKELVYTHVPVHTIGDQYMHMFCFISRESWIHLDITAASPLGEESSLLVVILCHPFSPRLTDTSYRKQSLISKSNKIPHMELWSCCSSTQSHLVILHCLENKI